MTPLESPDFVERVAFLRASENWARHRLTEYQLKRLRHFLRHVGANVPFYRELMKTRGLQWRDIRSVKDLRNFPLIDKQTIQDNHGAFVAENFPRDLLLDRSTGGSTGTPLTVLMDETFLARDKANTEYYMQVFDLNIFSHRSVRIYGDHVDQQAIDRGEYWRLEEDRRLVMSCYHITASTAPVYVAKINEFGPVYIHARPSSILPLAKYITQLGLQVYVELEGIFCDGEYITSGQREIIELAFRTRLRNVYGHTEGCVFGHSCPFSDSLHFAPQVGLLELLDGAGREVTEPGGRGEMVTTGFNNYAFPFIRYKTNDIAILDDQNCQCGRQYKMIREVEGRVQDYVLDMNCNSVPLAPAVFNYNELDWQGVREFKVVQEKIGELIVLVQLEPDAANDVNSPIEKVGPALKRILGQGFAIRFEAVSDIPKSAIGKHRYLDQRLDMALYP